MLFLAIAPNDIQLAPGNWHPGSIPRIRNLGEELQRVVGWHHFTQPATDAMAARRVTSATEATSLGALEARMVPRTVERFPGKKGAPPAG